VRQSCKKRGGTNRNEREKNSEKKVKRSKESDSTRKKPSIRKGEKSAEISKKGSLNDRAESAGAYRAVDGRGGR